MNVFEKYSIEEINKRTKISPISLRYIKNKEFNKIPRVKFIGFIRIIENEFKVDLSDLIKEYEDATKHIKKDDSEVKFEKPKKNRGFFVILFAIILIIIGGYYLYKTTNQNTTNTLVEQNYSITQETENNLTKSNEAKQNQTTLKKVKEVEEIEEVGKIKKVEENVNENNTTLKDIDITENNFTKENNTTIQNKTNFNSIQIIPKEKVWFRAINLDTNKTVEYLTSSPKELNGSKWYIKFGHGFITIQYGDEIITPNTKKIVRVLLKDGKYEFLKKANRYEK